MKIKLVKLNNKSIGIIDTRYNDRDAIDCGMIICQHMIKCKDCIFQNEIYSIEEIEIKEVEF